MRPGRSIWRTPASAFPRDSAKDWDDAVAEDFESLRKAGVGHAAFADIAAALKKVQSDAELNANNDRAIALHNAGKSAEAILLAERYAEATKARHGPETPEHALALNNLASLSAGH